MPIPNTVEALKAAGYTFDNEGTCRGCGATILWFTTPKGKKAPFERVQPAIGEVIESHFGRCPQAAGFRK